MKRNFYLALNEQEVPLAAFFATSAQAAQRWMHAMGEYPAFYDEIPLDDINGNSDNSEYTNNLVVNMIVKTHSVTPGKYKTAYGSTNRPQSNFGCSTTIFAMPGTKRIKASDII